jgi:drug/metabolite transporter (DMT)-like permease
MAIGTLQIGLYALWVRRLDWRILHRHLPFFLAIGFLVAVSTNLNYVAIAFIDAGTASMLAKLSTLFSIGFGIFWLRERLTSMQLVGAMIAIVGSLTIAFRPHSLQPEWGSLLVILSTFLYALHAALVKRHGGNIEFVNFFFFRLLCTTAVLFLIAAGRQTLAWPSAAAWIVLFVTATVDVVISRILYYAALRWLDMSLHAIVLTVSPAVAVLWSLLLFDTVPTGQQALGGVAVLVGVLIVTLKRPVPRPATAVQDATASGASVPTSLRR